MINPDAITVAGTADVYVAAVGSVAPTDPSAAPDGGVWTAVGAISDEGATFEDSKTLEPIPIWQLFYPARYVVTEKSAQISFAMREWNRTSVPLAFGGGAITEPSPGIYRYAPPAPGAIDERSMLLKWVDGDKNYLLVVPVGMVNEAVETGLAKSAAADLPITFAVVGQETGDPWYMLTDDPAWAPIGS